MVKTPWMEEEIPFVDAARIGTEKVIRDHATIGIVVATDGSIGELEREAYLEAEKSTITKLQEIGKPYVVVLNSMRPYSDETRRLKDAMEQQYQTKVVPVNCQQMHREDILHIMSAILMEFPVTRIDYFIPKWTEMLPAEHPVKAAIIRAAGEFLNRIDKIADASSIAADKNLTEQINEHSDEAFFKEIQLQNMNLCDENRYR